jgi:hypothetical protein
MAAHFSGTSLDYQLETKEGRDRRRVTHIVHGPRSSPTADLQYERWKSAERPIGKGGQGCVLLQTCRSPKSRRDTLRAVKVIRLASNAEQKKRYIREVETMVRFSHKKVRNGPQKKPPTVIR